MSGKELIKKYLDFFEEKGHAVIPSASLIPDNDPSVLFNTAGMQPLVPFLLGEDHPKGTRLADVQKCIRTGDLDIIGDDTHHTFFQMLGNWSLGDYFKEEAIAWSFEFLTAEKGLNIPLEKLAFTVYEGDEAVPRDEESATLWESHGVSPERIAYFGKDNFWSAGDTGPCGPSTEMFYWSGSSEAPAVFDPHDETWVEIWNDVFMAYNRDAQGVLTELANKNVDTGMGLERTVAVLAGTPSAYETDLFQPLISAIEAASGKSYKETSAVTQAMRIIADHVRASVFVLGDANGVTPSNKDQGYVLRRMIRRAVNHGRSLGITTSFLSSVAQATIDTYADLYPELRDNQETILSELEKEEEKFRSTLEQGLKQFEAVVAGLAGETLITGTDAFDLYQTYGFPIDMTVELAKERGLAVDETGFEHQLREHQELSRQSSQQKFTGGLADHSEMSVKYHTATHLLHAALHKVLGPQATQKGSNITAERLRFDFVHPDKLTPEQKQEVEDLVNAAIVRDYPVTWQEMPFEEAKSLGAIGLFEDNYGDVVKVYTVGDPAEIADGDPTAPTFSRELCGGPHVEHTGVLGHFRIKKEESSSAGVRRIKAVLE